MGVFLDQVEVFNRAPIDLVVRFDGQSKFLKPGKNVIPAMTVAQKNAPGHRPRASCNEADAYAASALVSVAAGARGRRGSGNASLS